ncbi:MAG: hypothetical protein KKA73_25005 [Chloroflexi bacterium]|nr:hypothetical protein [Chloroflexota bacterium]MBU1750956.1 hypothetical protein [Chloroflexota bacterium]
MPADRVIECSAPGRAGIIGNPTDMYGGAVLSCSVNMRARVHVTVSAAPHVTLETLEGTCVIAGRDGLRLQGDCFDVARAVLDYMQLPPLACRVRYDSDIPVRSGLAGSTALLVALTQALLAWQGRLLPSYHLAETARAIELNHLQVACGYQDAYMCAFGGLNYMDFRDKQFYREAEAELFATVEPLAAHVSQLPFILAVTGLPHESDTVHRPIRDRWLAGEPRVIQGYQRITELAQLGKKALLERDWPTLGRLMNENHAIQRGLGGSGESNERLIAAALKAGALGAKLAGAGDGGTIIALWPGPDPAPLEGALRQAGAAAVYRPAIVPGATIERNTP